MRLCAPWILHRLTLFFLYDFIVISKCKITTLLIFLQITHILFSMQSLALFAHFSHLCGKRSIAALYLSKLRWCKDVIMAVLISSSDSNHFPRRSLAHVQITINHTARDLESREDVPTPPSLNTTLDFAHLDGDKVLHYPGAK